METSGGGETSSVRDSHPYHLFDVHGNEYGFNLDSEEEDEEEEEEREREREKMARMRLSEIIQKSVFQLPSLFSLLLQVGGAAMDAPVEIEVFVTISDLITICNINYCFAFILYFIMAINFLIVYIIN